MSNRRRIPSVRGALTKSPVSGLARLRERGPALLIIAAVLLTFWPVVQAEFTTCDDDVALWRNPTFNPPTLHSLWLWWFTPTNRLWDPVLESCRGLLALATTASSDPVTGTHLNPYVFHAANLLIHLGTTLIVYQILRLLRFARWPACAGALLFGIHPLQVEPVAWITALKDVLCGFFAMSAIWLYLRSRGFAPGDEGTEEPANAARDGPRWCYWLAAVSFVMATLSKPTAVALPLVLPALALLRWRRPPRRIWGDVLVWLVLATPCIVLTKLAQPALSTNFVALWKRPLVATDAIAFYLAKLVWPASLTVDYGRRPIVIFQHGWAYWTWVLPLGVAIALCVPGKRARTLAIGAIIFLIPLLPVLGLISFDFQNRSTVGDRYVYLSFLGVAICAAWAMRRLPAGARVVAWLIIGALAIRSWNQTWHWQNSTALWTHALQINPDSEAAMVDLGVAADGRGDITTEIKYLNQAVAERPDMPEGYLGLGVAYVKLGKWALASDAYRRGFAARPTEVGNEVIRLAGNYGSTSQPVEATEYGKLAVELRPDSAMAHLNYGSALAESGDVPTAIAELAKAVDLDRGNVKAQCNLAATLALAGRYDEAAAHYQAALRLQPGLAVAETGLRQAQSMRERQQTTQPAVLQPQRAD